jgi:hypothetical protein
MLARIEMTQADIPKRQRMLAQQAGLLKRAAEQFNLTVVTTNQVTAGFGDGTGQRAALGVLWSHCVNTRLVLEQQQGVRCVRVRPCQHFEFAWPLSTRTSNSCLFEAVQAIHSELHVVPDKLNRWLM